MRCVAFGDRATLVELDADPGERTRATLDAAAALAAAFPETDVVAGAGAVLVVGAMLDEISVREALAARASAPLAATRDHVVRVRYDGEDLADVARATGLDPAGVVALHAGASYVVELVGFLPGFAYLGPLDPRLAIPRRPSPRRAVPAGAVAIAGAHTGVYPFASPGGWHLLGRAVGFAPFDPTRPAPIAFAPGDRVRFEPADASAEPEPPPVAPISAEPALALEVTVAPAGATVQDQGRRGQLRRGLPPSGPLDPLAHASANEAAGNEPGAAAIEIPLGALELRARGRLRLAADGEPARWLDDGNRLRIEPEGRAVRYLAVAGGVDVPLVLGARATLLVARVGGLGGRPLRRGDVVPIGGEATRPERFVERRAASNGVRALPGPHLDRFATDAFERFLASPWVVSRLGDRVGVRLEGARVARRDADAGAPTPMIRGAVQVTTDGTPIVLGPDHPTTGGYPVLAVVPADAWSDLARLPPGAAVRFLPPGSAPA